MSDERWLSRDERREQSERSDISSAMRMVLDHAEAADELIAELASALRWAKTYIPCSGPAPPAHTAATKSLARVDALKKDTA